jgi:multicomponent Na+:H+ antiporter subunit D
VAAFSLAGMPPLSGFFAKLILIKAGIEAESYAIVATAVVVGLLTLFSMTKIWSEAFWKGPSEGDGRADDGTHRPAALRAPTPAMIGVCAALAAVTVLVGVFAGPVFGLAQRTADELLDPDRYIGAVLGDQP